MNIDNRPTPSKLDQTEVESFLTRLLRANDSEIETAKWRPDSQNVPVELYVKTKSPISKGVADTCSESVKERYGIKVNFDTACIEKPPVEETPDD